MTLQETWDILNAKKLHLAVSALVFAVIAMGVALSGELKYSASNSYIVIQEQRFSDPYTQARSADYLANLLARIVSTDSFRASVAQGRPQIASYINKGDSDKIRKDWNKNVEVATTEDTGILTISVFHEVPSISTSILSAVSTTLTEDANTYLGSADVKLLKIDGPITSRYPVKPNVGLNTVAGGLVGLLLAGVYFIGRTPKKSTSRVGFAGVGAQPDFDKWLKRGRLA